MPASASFGAANRRALGFGSKPIVVAHTYTTWNPADKGANITLSAANLTFSQAVDSSWNAVRSTIAKSTQKWYAEILFVHSNNGDATQLRCGVMSATGALDHEVGFDAQGWSIGTNGILEHNSINGGSTGVTFADGDILGIAWDADAGKLWFSKNNSWLLSGDPAAGSNPNYISVAGALFLAGSGSKSAAAIPTGTLQPGPTLNFTPPTGFNAGWYT